MSGASLNFRRAGNGYMEIKPVWISINDSLPTETGHYLVYRNTDIYGCKIRIGFWSHNEWNCDDTMNRKVTHWMPLPIPPMIGN